VTKAVFRNFMVSSKNGTGLDCLDATSFDEHAGLHAPCPAVSSDPDLAEEKLRLADFSRGNYASPAWR